MEKDTLRGIAMISAATHALKTFRQTGEVGSAMNEVTRLAKQERDEQAKVGMIAAASKALKIAEREDGMTDRQIINQVMSELPEIIATVKQHSFS